MKRNIALKQHSLKAVPAKPTQLIATSGQREKLNTVVYVKGRANVLLKELFSPSSHAAIVIRRKDGSYSDPCDFQPYLRERTDSKRITGNNHLAKC